jgi:uncharacterized membrane protein YgcG
LADADEQFGADEIMLRSLTDGAGLFRKGERGRVEAAMAEIGRRFPQIFVAVYTGSLGEVSNIRQFGFWLLNRAAFEDVPVTKPNEAGILFTIDPESKAAGIAFGYLLDPFLEETDTFECLSRAHSHWLDGRYADGLEKAIRHLGKILGRRCRQARRDPEKFERKVMPLAQMGDLVRRIRAGHRAGGVEEKKEVEK